MHRISILEFQGDQKNAKFNDECIGKYCYNRQSFSFNGFIFCIKEQNIAIK